MLLHRALRQHTTNTNRRGILAATSMFYSSKIIGIDLGTTNSCVAVVMSSGGEGDDINSDIRVLENPDTGKRTTPSYVAFKKGKGTQEKLIGESAKRQAAINPKHTFYATKRLIGKKFEDPAIQSERKHVGFEIIRHSNGDAWVALPGGEKFSPSEIGAFVLQKMKQCAEEYLHDKVTQAVITVPAYFNDMQRNATKDAGRIAGLDVKRIINEPTAASLAYGVADRARNGTIAVFDLGGGTFDISIMDINDGVFQVKATNGDTHLGGEDFDQLISGMILDAFKSEEGVDLRGDAVAMGRVKEAAENAKKQLDFGDAEIQLPFITSDGKNLDMTITRAEFEQRSQPLIERALVACKNCAKDAGLKAPKDVSEVVLVGGQTRMPKVKEAVQNLFGKLPNKSVNPDECVAIGAAIQGSILSGHVSDVMLIDVTPLSLGTQVVGDIFSRVIPRNTPIPITKTLTYTTTEDNQNSMTFPVYQGEREKATENRELGRFSLSGITPAPKGVAQVELSFHIDANGIVNCTARDTASGKAAHTTVQSSSGLSDAEVEKMVKDAERFAEQDRLHKARAEATNEGQNVENILRDALTKLDETDLPAEKRAAAQKALSEFESVSRSSTNVDEMKKSLEQLKEIQNQVSTILYRKEAAKRKQG